MEWTRAKIAAVLAGAFLSIGGTAFAADGSKFQRETEALVEATAAFFAEAEARSATPKRPLGNVLRLVPTPTALEVETGGMASALDTDRGAVRHLTGYRITWYPMDRLFGAVDFMGSWDNARNLVCGYVTWDLSDPEAPELTDVVATFVDIGALANEDRAAREATLLDANCAFAEIDANYAVLN